MPQDISAQTVIENDDASPPSSLVRLLSKKRVLQIVGRSFPAIWADICKGKFPQPVTIGCRPYWYENELLAWLQSLPRRFYKGM